MNFTNRYAEPMNFVDQFFQAVGTGNVGYIEDCIRLHGVNVNSVCPGDILRRNALMVLLAVPYNQIQRYQRLDCIDCLVRNRINLLAQDANGDTALHITVQVQDNMSFFWRVFRKEYDLMSVANIFGNTPFHVLCSRIRQLHFKHFLDLLKDCRKHVPFNKLNNEKQNPLLFACMKLSNDGVLDEPGKGLDFLFLQPEIDLDAKDVHGLNCWDYMLSRFQNFYVDSEKDAGAFFEQFRSRVLGERQKLRDALPKSKRSELGTKSRNLRVMLKNYLSPLVETVSMSTTEQFRTYNIIEFNTPLCKSADSEFYDWGGRKDDEIPNYVNGYWRGGLRKGVLNSTKVGVCVRLDKDGRLREFVKSVKKNLADKKFSGYLQQFAQGNAQMKKQLRPSMISIVMEVAKMVSEFYGGPLTGQLMQECMRHMEEVQGKRRTNLLNLGLFEFGVTRLRCLLMKYLCDTVLNIQCRLLRVFPHFPSRDCMYYFVTILLPPVQYTLDVSVSLQMVDASMVGAGAMQLQWPQDEEFFLHDLDHYLKREIFEALSNPRAPPRVLKQTSLCTLTRLFLPDRRMPQQTRAFILKKCVFSDPQVLKQVTWEIGLFRFFNYEHLLNAKAFFFHDNAMFVLYPDYRYNFDSWVNYLKVKGVGNYRYKVLLAFLRLIFGVKFLHDNGLAHGNLTPLAILVDSPKGPSLFDFDLKVFGYGTVFSVSAHDDPLYAKERSLWCAPEHAQSTFGSSREGDVYSLGVFFEQYQDFIVRSLEGVGLADRVRPFGQMAKQCMERDPRGRPNIFQVYEFFYGVCKNIVKELGKNGVRPYVEKQVEQQIFVEEKRMVPQQATENVSSTQSVPMQMQTGISKKKKKREPVVIPRLPPVVKTEPIESPVVPITSQIFPMAQERVGEVETPEVLVEKNTPNVHVPTPEISQQKPTVAPGVATMAQGNVGGMKNGDFENLLKQQKMEYEIEMKKKDKIIEEKNEIIRTYEREFETMDTILENFRKRKRGNRDWIVKDEDEKKKKRRKVKTE